MTARVQIVLGALFVVVLLGVSACGDNGDPSSAPTVTATATASASPTKKPAPPLSAFEDRAPVKALRIVLRDQAKAVNAKNLDFAHAGAVMTQSGKATAKQMMAEDVGLYYPGPNPFTPTRVVTSGDQALIYGCLMTNGFALEHRNGKPARGAQVEPGHFIMKRVNGAWKMDGSAPDQSSSCKGVTVRRVRW